MPFLIFGSFRLSDSFSSQYPIHEYLPVRTLKQFFKNAKGFLIKKTIKIQNTIPNNEDVKSKRRFFLLFDAVLIVFISIV
mgnify:CR=1 FL=1